MSTTLTLLTTPYPDVCFSSLVGIRGTCEPRQGPPTFWVDDIPGIDLARLAQVATQDAPSGAKLGAKLLESAARYLAADVENLYDGKFKVQASLVAGCSTCAYMGSALAGTELGTRVENLSGSAYGVLLIDKLSAQVQQTGTFHVVLDDGSDDNVQVIEWPFQAGERVDFINVGYKTRAKLVRIYLEESGVPLPQLRCPRSGSNCGCTGKPATVETLVYGGTNNGANSQQAYGFVPCASVLCDAADLLCALAKGTPRTMGLALLAKFAELYYSEVPLSTRINRVVSNSTEDKQDEAKRYAKLYADRLNGSRSVRGVKDVVFDTLKTVSDVCVACDTPVRTQWATG